MPEVVLALPQRLLRGALVGDVARDAGEPDRATFLVELDLALARDPAQLACVGASDAVGDVPGGAADRAGRRRRHEVGILG